MAGLLFQNDCTIKVTDTFIVNVIVSLFLQWHCHIFLNIPCTILWSRDATNDALLCRRISYICLYEKIWRNLNIFLVFWGEKFWESLRPLLFWMENMALHCVPILHKSAWHAVYVETHITKQRTKILYVNNSNPSISMLPSKNLCTHIPARLNQPSPNNTNGHTQSHATQAYWQGVCVFVVYSVCACAALRCFRCCGSSGPLASASWSSLN